MTDSQFSAEDWIAHCQSLPYFRRRVEIARRVRPRTTRFIYKYRTIDPKSEGSIDRLRDILVRGRLWLSSPLDFNDPFDMSAKITVQTAGRGRYERLYELLKSRGVKWKERKKLAGRLSNSPAEEWLPALEQAYQKALKEIGVCSFAGDPRSILMWSHYAEDHSGVCLQFERARNYAIFSRALTVNYSETYPIIDWVKDFGDSLSTTILQKHDGWSYEREERIVLMGQANEPFQFNLSAITGIILGCRSSTNTQNVIDALLAERKKSGEPDVRVYIAKKHNSDYKLSLFRSA